MRRIFPTVLLAWLFSVGALAEKAPAESAIVVGYYEFPPYTWTAEDGTPSGSVLTLTERLLRQAGYRGEYRSLPGARLYAGLQDGSVQLWPGAGGKAELIGHTYEARHAMGHFNLALYHRQDVQAPTLPDGLRGKGVIVISGYSYWKQINDLLMDPGMGISIHRTSTHASALEMLLRKRGDYLLDYQAPVEQVRKELGLSPLPYIVLQRLESRLIASRHTPGSLGLLEKLDRAYEELQAAGEDLRVE